MGTGKKARWLAAKSKSACVYLQHAFRSISRVSSPEFEYPYSVWRHRHVWHVQVQTNKNSFFETTRNWTHQIASTLGVGSLFRSECPAAHQLQVTLAADLHTPADQSPDQDTASARAAPRSTSTSKPSTHPVRCQPPQLVVPAEHRLQATLAADL